LGLALWSFNAEMLAIRLAAPIAKRLASLEAQQVISLRLALLADGSEPAGAEAVCMVSEKMSAALEVQHAIAVAAFTSNAGLIPARIVAIYRRMIRANRYHLGGRKIPARGSPVEELKEC
jgi:hypothetical protein